MSKQSKTASILSDALIGTGIGAGAGTLYGGYTGMEAARRDLDAGYQDKLLNWDRQDGWLRNDVANQLDNVRDIHAVGKQEPLPDMSRSSLYRLQDLVRRHNGHVSDRPEAPTAAAYERRGLEGAKDGIPIAAGVGAAIGGATGLAVGVLRKLLSKNKDSKVRG